MKNIVIKGAVIAQWICLCLPSCSPGFKFHVHHLHFNRQILCCFCHCVEKSTNINKMGLAPIDIISNLVFWSHPVNKLEPRHVVYIKARSDLRNSHTFTQLDREFSNWPKFTRALKSWPILLRFTHSIWTVHYAAITKTSNLHRIDRLHFPWLTASINFLDI